MDNELKVPNHIAIILDGNGRWAQKTQYAARLRPYRRMRQSGKNV